jgi:hypothetical protein
MKHLKDTNETYISHFKFASKIGVILVIRGIIFVLHAAFPICNIPKKWNLEDTMTKVYKWNLHANRRTKK